MSLLLTLEEAAGGGGGGGFDSGLLSNGDFATGDLTDWVVSTGAWTYAFVDPYHCAQYIASSNSNLQNIVGKRHVWESNTVYRLSYRIVATGANLIINVYDGGSNFYTNINQTTPGVYTFDIDTTGKTLNSPTTDGLRLYGRTLEDWAQITELSLHKL